MRVMRRLLDAAFRVSGVGSGNRNGRAGVSVVRYDPWYCCPGTQHSCVTDGPTTFPLVFTHNGDGSLSDAEVVNKTDKIH